MVRSHGGSRKGLPGVMLETAAPPVFGKENDLGAAPGAGVLLHASAFCIAEDECGYARRGSDH
jgi:hypothetical protein